MQEKSFRHLVFKLHRYIGLAVGLIAILVGLTGSLLVFQSEISNFDQPIAGKSPLRLPEQLKTAQAALSDGALWRIYFPVKPEDAFMVRFKLPQENKDYGQSYVYLDRYSDKVLRVDSSLKISLGDRIINSFVPLHYGTFWGLPSRIFYVFVGLAPLVLFITSFVMWRYRYQPKTKICDRSIELSHSHRN
ncbi:PepSY-associated TM helix domain-containing protein [Nostoc sp.]|uniref:PepSY-associated TM helix domain-containing protein n=1 Tax=Nostoc sp. TaxID=1180 RepID=UPI002FF7CE8C